ncbi:MAG: hypothetical protein ACRDHW_16115 [Ktedonobacteraceae bacterium]
MFNSNGAVVGSQLYGPYGNKRYSTGTLPISIGFTGQQTDGETAHPLGQAGGQVHIPPSQGGQQSGGRIWGVVIGIVVSVVIASIIAFFARSKVPDHPQKDAVTQL